MSEDQKTALEIAKEKAEAAALEVNKSRSGVGPRLRVGMTRGKNPQVITFEQFDESQPDTLPKSVEQFMGLTINGVQQNTDGLLNDYLIRGFNDASYEAASDPLAEYVVGKWEPLVQSTFRQAVRNYSRGLGISLEDAVDIIRPGFVKKFGE